MTTPSDISGYRRIKRASRACQRCHTRKVRCDATVTGFPCTNCRLDSFPCQAFTGGRERRKQLSLVRARALAGESEKQSPPRRARPPVTQPGVSHEVQVPFSAYPCIKALDSPESEVDGLPILKLTGCLHLPGRAEVDVLLRHYFLYVHPLFPIIDEAAFWSVYKSPCSGDELIPLCLFRAIIFSASCFVPADIANRCGYGSLLDARDDLYHKAKRRTAALYYSSDFDVYANSHWLRIAIKEANTVHTTHTLDERSLDDGDRSEFKRLRWCCLVRDRIVSLGMRRPLQITGKELHEYPLMLATNDMNEEIFGSLVYSSESKSALFELYTSLCHFATAVTELVTIAFPSVQHTRNMLDDQDPSAGLDRLESARSALLLWELDWMTYMEGKNASLHESIPFFSSLLAIYYQSARIALCNRVCVVLEQMVHHKTRYLQQLQLCQSELLGAIACIAGKVRLLMIIERTTTPYILLTINSQADKKKSRDIFVLFNAINRVLGLRYHLTRVSNLISRALWLSQLFKDAVVGCQKLAGEPSNSAHSSNLFTLSLQQYTQLLQYIDESMSIPWDSVQETEILYAAASTFQVPSDEELTPVWIEAMENFFFGPGSLLALTSADHPDKPPAVTRESQPDCDEDFRMNLEMPWVIETALRCQAS
ncbi:hypothetical protein BDW68DRAFT_199001 [Aspergillus falconensis]